jgi:hypothetical protein
MSHTQQSTRPSFPSYGLLRQQVAASAMREFCQLAGGTRVRSGRPSTPHRRSEGTPERQRQTEATRSRQEGCRAAAPERGSGAGGGAGGGRAGGGAGARWSRSAGAWRLPHRPHQWTVCITGKSRQLTMQNTRTRPLREPLRCRAPRWFMAATAQHRPSMRSLARFAA